MIDLSHWLRPLDGENPSGESLRNDPRFHELERLVEPQIKITRDERNNPSSQIAVPVDWPAVLAKAEELRAHGRDLRLLVVVVRALANENRLAGLAAGLTLIARTLDEHWETMHPELRANAPPQEAALRRTNALLQLQNSQDGLLGDLRRMTFFTPRGIGPISGRDLEQGSLDERTVLGEAASGLNNAEKAALASAHAQLVSRVRTGCAAHADQAEAEMTALLADARSAIEALATVDAALNARRGGSGATVPELKRLLERMLATLEIGAAKRQGATGALKEAEVASPTPGPRSLNGDGGEAATTITAVATIGARFPDRLASRDEVVKCLDLVIGFYDRTEPSSPIPHLARRIRRMVSMDFMELMEDLAPSGLKEFRLLAGVPDSRKLPQKDER